MMTTISKRMKGVFAIFIALQYVFVPLVVFAEDVSTQESDPGVVSNSGKTLLTPDERRAEMEKRREERRKMIEERRNNVASDRQEARQDALCERVVSMANNILQHRQNKSDRIADRIEEHGLYNEEKRNNFNAKWSDIRMGYDEARNKMYDKLNEEAETDEQKAAVKKFVDDVDRAVSIRRASIDEAVQSFQSDVDKLVSSKKKSSGDIANSFEAAAEKAVETAKSECASDTDPKVVREHLLANLKSARADAIEEKKDLENIKDEIQKLVDTRKAAVKAAREKFVDSVEAARKELKEAF